MSEATPETTLTPLQKAQLRMQELRAKGELHIERLDPVEKARRNPKSKTLAIKAHCWECMGAGADPNTKQNIRDCGVTTCALHPHRPWQNVSGRSLDQMTEAEIEAAAQEGIDQGDDADDEDADSEA
jgi:hypothetical protein